MLRILSRFETGVWEMAKVLPEIPAMLWTRYLKITRTRATIEDLLPQALRKEEILLLVLCHLILIANMKRWEQMPIMKVLVLFLIN